MSHWIKIGTLEDIPTRGARRVVSGEVVIAVFRTSENEVYALEDSCPHKGGPLSQGIVHDCKVTCPLHNWVLDLKTGEAVGPDDGRAKVYPVRFEQGEIFLEIAEDVKKIA